MGAHVGRSVDELDTVDMVDTTEKTDFLSIDTSIYNTLYIERGRENRKQAQKHKAHQHKNKKQYIKKQNREKYTEGTTNPLFSTQKKKTMKKEKNQEKTKEAQEKL